MRKIIYYLILAVLIVTAGFSLFKVVDHIRKCEIQQREYDELIDSCVIDERPDMDKLREENEDIEAWLRFDGTEEISIDYPVMNGRDNEYYLHHDVNGQPSILGCLFLDMTCSYNLDDEISIIYGHNMKNGSMFGTLGKLMDKDTLERNRNFTLYTENGETVYEIVSVFITHADSWIYTEERNYEYRKKLYDVEEYPVKGRVCLLSTCYGKGSRLVVCGLEQQKNSQ